MIVNMGPHHLSMHGVFRLIVTLDGEDIVDCELILSYLPAMFMEAITVNGPEQLGNIQAPKKANYIRVIMLELSRIASHLLCFGSFSIFWDRHYWWRRSNKLGFTRPNATSIWN
ncbi:hypothetical protein Gotur_009017 [Gossypium turneri]